MMEDARISFRVLWVFGGYIFEHRGLAGRYNGLVSVGGDFWVMNLGLPNQIAAPNRRLRFGLVPWSFGFFMSQGSAVGELDQITLRTLLFV